MTSMAMLLPVVRYVTFCVLSYGFGTSSVGSRQPWSAEVFLCRRAAANNHEKDLIGLLETLTGTVSYEFIDLWTEVRDWSLRPV